MRQQIFTVTENASIALDTWRMHLAGDCTAITAPGQFVNIQLDGFYLRRPISVCDVRGDGLCLIYKVVGQGTRAMSELAPGARLDVLSGLGNGFDLSKAGKAPLLIGGGVGTPPLYYLAKCLLEQGARPMVTLGFNSAADAILIDDFAGLGLDVAVSTVDGSFGQQGFVTQAAASMAERADFLYTCGPEPMLKAVYNDFDLPGQFSFEERMGCGFGACMGCTCATKYGYKRICADGPVLDRGEIVW